MLASVADPRDRRGVRYSLVALLAIAVLATAAGMRSYAGFAMWTASASSDVLARVDAADLDRRLGAYFTAMAAARSAAAGELLAVSLDGKTLRGARSAGRWPFIWCPCSPTTCGWSSGSSRSTIRATKFPV